MRARHANIIVLRQADSGSVTPITQKCDADDRQSVEINSCLIKGGLDQLDTFITLAFLSSVALANSFGLEDQIWTPRLAGLRMRTFCHFPMFHETTHSCCT